MLSSHFIKTFTGKSIAADICVLVLVSIFVVTVGIATTQPTVCNLILTKLDKIWKMT
jgi:hypothetical protein